MIELFIPYGAVGILGFIVIYMIINPSKVEIWHGLLARLFAGFSERAEKSAVSKEIQGRINIVSKKINKESDGSIPFGVKIEWIKELNKDAFIREGNVVVRMQNHKNQAENLALATLMFLSIGCLPTARSYVEDNVLKAIDFTLAKRILITEHQEKALRYFTDEIFNSEIKKQPIIQKYTNALEKLNDDGLFTRILLKELLMLGDRIAQQIPSDNMKNETKEFVEMMETLAFKQKDVDINPTYSGNYIKSSIILIAKYNTFITHGTEPYIKHIKKEFIQGINIFYLLGSGKNVLPTNLVAKDLENDGSFLKVYEDKYYLPYKEGKRTESKIIIFVRKNT